ncbi:Sec-independent protein translocase protein TatB [Devosia sp. Naph2]|uniref:Sec-independent protein translocase protein TatB n=1 Tax=Devosia polycyclovorans TaxID=3345148 RepID=UPI0035CE9CD8
MLGLGWTEMLVIGVVALIFIGPKDLPVVMGRVGKVIGQVQRMGREFQREINRSTGLDEVRNLRTSITSPLKQTADEIRKDFNSIGKDGKESPSGVIKPTDPSKESVVEAIQQQAGMAPAKKSANEMAAEYGFSPTKAEPVKAPPRATKAAASKGATSKSSRSKTAAGTKATTSKATTSKATTSKTTASKPAAEKSPAKKFDAQTASAEASAPKARAARSPAAKATKPASARTSAKAAGKPAENTDKPAKSRAPRKKPAEAAGKTE